MSGRLQAELRQRRPFAEPLEEALLNVLRTADAVDRALADALKPFGLTSTQYNVLRILRGAGDEGRTCGEIGERMVTRDPDVTRMLDRLHLRGLIARERSTEDRRVVRSKITRQGERLLDQTRGPLEAAMQERFGHAGKEQLAALIGALETLRAVRD